MPENVPETARASPSWFPKVCSEEFTATRRDAKTCSDGCKQMAYRKRKEVQEDR